MPNLMAGNAAVLKHAPNCTGTELNFVHNVTSPIQTQLAAKASTSATVIAAVSDTGELAAAPNTTTAVNAIITALIASGILAAS